MQGFLRWNRSVSMEANSAAPEIMQASSCLKHFFAYDGPENWGNETRFNFDAQVTGQDLADTYVSP